MLVLGAVAVLAAIAANYARDVAYMVNALEVMAAAAIAFVWVLRQTDETRIAPVNEYNDGVIRAGVIATCFWGIVGFLVGRGTRPANWTSGPCERLRASRP